MTLLVLSYVGVLVLGGAIGFCIGYEWRDWNEHAEKMAQIRKDFEIP